MDPTTEPTPPDEPAATRTRRARPDWARAWTIALGVAGGLLLSTVVGATVERLRDLLVVLLLSLFLSFGMEPAVQWLQQRGLRRGFGTMLVFIATFIALAAFAVSMAALVSDQVGRLVTNAPGLLDGLAAQVAALPEPVGPAAAEFLREQAAAAPDRLEGVAATVGRGALGLGTTVAGGVLDALTALLVTFYLVADGPRLRRTLSTWLAPDRQRELLAVWELAIGKTGGYVYSRLLTAVASGAVHVFAFTLLDLPYSVALGLWVGLVSSLIPVVGTYLAGALPLVVALATDPRDALLVLLVIVSYQQVENYLVAPRITERTLELHPAIAFLSVLVGGALLGAAGALLALPVTAIVQALATTYGDRHEVLEHELLTTPPPRDAIWTADVAAGGRAGSGGESPRTVPGNAPKRPGPGHTTSFDAVPDPAEAEQPVQPGVVPQPEGSTTTNVEPNPAGE